MLTIRGYFCVDAASVPAAPCASTGLVRKASTSNLLSFETNVNDSTAATDLPVRTCALRSVRRFAVDTAEPAGSTYSWARSDGDAYVYARVSRTSENEPTVPGNDTIV